MDFILLTTKTLKKLLFYKKTPVTKQRVDCRGGRLGVPIPVEKKRTSSGKHRRKGRERGYCEVWSKRTYVLSVKRWGSTTELPVNQWG